MGFEVQTAANGLQALIKARRYHPDVLIIDINMPEADGLSVSARLQPLNIIVITASSYAETVERCESFGAFHVRKGPDLWDEVESTLRGLFPDAPRGVVEKETLRLRGDWNRPRVLVVDSDPDVGTFLLSRLSEHGIDTLVAHDVLQAYRIASREEPSVIVTEYLISNGNALYLLRRLRATPTTARIPVLVMTANDLDETTKSELKREVRGRPGVERFVVKSSNTDELFAALQKFCAFTIQ
jgi:CheY-like chemotaxis protein